MKILFLLESAGAGVGRHVADLAESLTTRGHQVHLVYNSGRTDAMFRRRLEDAQHHLAGVAGIPMRRVPHLHDTVLIAALRAYARRNGPFDIIHCHSTKAGFAGRLGLRRSGTVLVYTPHAPLTMRPDLSWAARAATRALEMVLSRRTEAIIAVSDDEADHLKALGVPAEKVFVVPNGVPAMKQEDTRRAKARQCLGLCDDHIVIGCVGRLEKQKRIDLLLHAAAQLPVDLRSAVQLVIVGGGSLDQSLKALAATIGIDGQVIWAGELERPDELMPAFDVFAMASDYEGMPYALLEAASAGLPTVATRVGGVESIVTDGQNGFIVDRGDISGLSRRLGVLIQHPELRIRMSAEARSVAPRFSIDRMTEGTLSVYSQVFSQATAGDPAAALAR